MALLQKIKFNIGHWSQSHYLTFPYSDFYWYVYPFIDSELLIIQFIEKPFKFIRLIGNAKQKSIGLLSKWIKESRKKCFY